MLAWFPLETSPVILQLLERHADGDWGHIEIYARKVNEESLESGGELFSVYKTPFNGMLYLAQPQEIWIITEADRSTTTVMLPEEY